MDNITIKGVPLPFVVKTSGWIHNRSYHSTPGTKNTDVMLTVFLAGKGIYSMGDIRCEISSGMVGVIFPESPGILATQPLKPYSHLYCRFNGDYAIFLARQIFLARGENFFFFDKLEELADLLRPMGYFNLQTPPEQIGWREILLMQALSLLFGTEKKSDVRALSKHTIIDYLNQHIADPTDLEKIASFFSVSKSTLCRVVRKECDQTVQKLSETIKIEWAKVLLQAGIYNINEVALRVGYPDPLYFSRVFQKNTGTCPRNWC